jgi:tetratricopeptide (TPR) repeat protein
MLSPQWGWGQGLQASFRVFAKISQVEETQIQGGLDQRPKSSLMSNTYFTWDKFVENFGPEMRIAGEVFDSMAGSGLKDGCLCCFDFTFVSNRRENLERLAQFLKSHYFYSITGIELKGSQWDLDGKTAEIPVNADYLMYWALDMCKRGYEFDAEFDAYGAPFDPAAQTFHVIDSAEEQAMFDRGVKEYEQGNLSGALVTWSEVIALNPKNANAYYSRAIVKNELHTWKSALRDYDAALEISPTFGSALLNRGSVRATTQSPGWCQSGNLRGCRFEALRRPQNVGKSKSAKSGTRTHLNHSR